MENKGKPIKTGRSIDGRTRKRNIVEKWEAVSIFADEQKLRIFSLIKLGDFSFVRKWDEVSRLISQFDRPRNSLGRISRIEHNIIMAQLVSSSSPPPSLLLLGCHHRKLIKSILHSLPPSPPTNFYVFYEFSVHPQLLNFELWNDLCEILISHFPYSINVYQVV